MVVVKTYFACYQTEKETGSAGGSDLPLLVLLCNFCHGMDMVHFQQYKLPEFHRLLPLLELPFSILDIVKKHRKQKTQAAGACCSPAFSHVHSHSVSCGSKPSWGKRCHWHCIMVSSNVLSEWESHYICISNLYTHWWKNDAKSGFYSQDQYKIRESARRTMEEPGKHAVSSQCRR